MINGQNCFAKTIKINGKETNSRDNDERGSRCVSTTSKNTSQRGNESGQVASGVPCVPIGDYRVGILLTCKV